MCAYENKNLSVLFRKNHSWCIVCRSFSLLVYTHNSFYGLHKLTHVIPSSMVNWSDSRLDQVMTGLILLVSAAFCLNMVIAFQWKYYSFFLKAF